MKLIRFINTPQAAFIMLIIGAFGQAFHTSYILYDISNYSNLTLKLVSAIVLSIFFSGGLLFFSIRAGLTSNIAKKNKYEGAAKSFAFLEGSINVYYWLTKILMEDNGSLIDNINIETWLTLLLAMILAILLPVIIYYYAGEVEAVLTTNENDKLQLEVLELSNRLKTLEKTLENLKGTLLIKLPKGDMKYDNVEFKLRKNE